MALERLAVAQTLQLRQALLVLFARLLVHDLSSTLAVLQAHTWSAMPPQGLPPGGGLGLVLVMWAREHSDLCGSYDMKILSAALGVLLIHAPGYPYLETLIIRDLVREDLLHRTIFISNIQANV